MKMPPENVARYFFQSLMHNQCHVCWGLFSKKTQDDFLRWTIGDIYRRHPEAAKASSIGRKEVRLLFENNDASLMKTFWKRFFFSSNAGDFFRFGYPQLVRIEGRKAAVNFVLKYPDGRQVTSAEFLMISERGQWKLGYVESGFPF